MQPNTTMIPIIANIANSPSQTRCARDWFAQAPALLPGTRGLGALMAQPCRPPELYLLPQTQVRIAVRPTVQSLRLRASGGCARAAIPYLRRAFHKQEA